MHDAKIKPQLHDASLGLVYLHVGMHDPVIHGDLKGVCFIVHPSQKTSVPCLQISIIQTNILVDEHGRACLADFGLSRIKVKGDTSPVPTSYKERRGTVRWMSPESLRGGQSDEKTDIYSFGMTMYEV